MNQYMVILKDPWGANPRFFTQFHSLRYGRSDRYSYSMTMQVPAKDIDLKSLQPDMILEVHKARIGGVMKLDAETCWFLRRWRIKTDADGREILELFARDSLYILGSRINAYPVDHANSTLSYPARQALAQVVYNNTRGGAITERQIASGYFQTETAVTSGSSITKDCAWQQMKSLLDEIVNQSRSKGSWITYDIVYSGTFPAIFTTFAEQRGNDLTSRIELSPSNNNVAEPELIFDYEDEATAAYLLGAGEEATRLVGRADSSRIAAGPFSRREVKKENTQVDDQTTANNEAEEILDKCKGRVYFSGNIVQTESMRYGIDWGYGDKIRASYKDYNFDCRVESVEIFHSNASGTITDHVNAVVRGEAWL